MTLEEIQMRGKAVREALLQGATLSAVPDAPSDEMSSRDTFIWGEVWGDPALDMKTRSCITIGILIALNRPNQLVTHFQAARNNGLSREELRAVCAHASVYAGMPASVDARQLLDSIPDPIG